MPPPTMITSASFDPVVEDDTGDMVEEDARSLTERFASRCLGCTARRLVDRIIDFCIVLAITFDVSLVASFNGS